MIPPHSYQMLPWITPWVDTRGWGGQTATSSANWVDGVFASWPEALRSGYALTANPPWGTSTTWAVTTNHRTSIVAPSAGALTLPTGADAQDLYLIGTRITDFGVLAPSRSLKTDPVPIDIADGGAVATLGGITYRNTYSRRRQWVIDLLLDGPLQYYADNTNDLREMWQNFLRRADLGVTVYLWGENWSTSSSLANSTYPYAYPGCNNRITGALVDATNLRWTPPANGLLTRYEVSLTIAEVEPPGRSS